MIEMKIHGQQIRLNNRKRDIFFIIKKLQKRTIMGKTFNFKKITQEKCIKAIYYTLHSYLINLTPVLYILYPLFAIDGICLRR